MTRDSIVFRLERIEEQLDRIEKRVTPIEEQFEIDPPSFDDLQEWVDVGHKMWDAGSLAIYHSDDIRLDDNYKGGFVVTADETNDGGGWNPKSHRRYPDDIGEVAWHYGEDEIDDDVIDEYLVEYDSEELPTFDTEYATVEMVDELASLTDSDTTITVYEDENGHRWLHTVDDEFDSETWVFLFHGTSDDISEFATALEGN